MADRALADTSREEILALCNDFRGGHLTGFITKRDGVVSGIDNDRRGRFHVLHHPPARTRAHQAPDAGLHLRIAFRFLVLFLYLLLAHAQLTRPPASLPGIVD